MQVTGRVYTRDSVAAALRLPVEVCNNTSLYSFASKALIYVGHSEVADATLDQRMHELAWLVGNDLSAHLLDSHRVPELLGIPTVATKTKVCRIRRMLKYSDVCRRMLPYAD